MIIPSIIRALQDENSVIISGLGTFSVKKLPSQIKDDILFPPKNIVEFQYSKDIDGFDFVSKLSKWKQIRLNEAQDEVTEWLNLLEKGLEHNQSLFFENFGTFSKNLSGEILFQSMPIYQLNIENEGFEPVCLIAHNKKQNISKPDEQQVIDKRIFLIRKKRKRDMFWFVLTIFVTIALLFALFFKKEIIHFYQTFFKKNEIPAVIEREEAIPFELIEVEEEIPVSKKNETVNVPTVSSNEIYLPYEKGKYYVIAGSFTKNEDALRHIKEKNLEKYKAKIIVEPQNPRKRICIGVFDNETDATKFAMQIDKNYWVLK